LRFKEPWIEANGERDGYGFCTSRLLCARRPELG
jgi:hypothetical protein